MAMSFKRAQAKYTDWLVDSVNVIEGENYEKMLRELNRLEFFSIVQYDEDRAADGVALRETWAYDNDYRGDLSFGPCTILEVLVGIALRVEFQLFGSRWAEVWDHKRIFWDMIKNLDLLDLGGDLSRLDYEKIVTVCENFCHRKYSCDGFGNIFCIFDAPKDIRKLNIWTQMGLYIREKWPI